MSARTDKADKAVYGQGLVLGKRKAALKTALAFTAAVLVSSILSSSVTAAVVLSITTAGQTPVLAKILEKASYAPRDRINNYQNFFSMSPNDLSNMDSLTFIAPFDYECQSRAPYGPQPCPQGVPSRCRYYLFNDVSDICAYAYCKATKSTDPDFQYNDEYSDCCKVFENLWPVPRQNIVRDDPKIAYGAVWRAAETASGAPPQGLIQDEYEAAVAADPKVCDAQIDWLHFNTWGHKYWWDDHSPGTEPNFNVFKITRYEYAAQIGIQFYGTTGDTIVVERKGISFYKPRGHAEFLEILLNESLVITPAAQAAGAVSNTTRRLNAKGRPMSHDELVKDMRAGSGHPAFKNEFKGVLKVSRDQAPAGPMRRMLDEVDETGDDSETHHSRRKLGFFSALMTSGNFMMMQAGAF